MIDPVVVAVFWTLVNGVGFGFTMRGALVASARMREVVPFNGLALLQARRNLRVERIRVGCQLFGLAAGLLVLTSRLGAAPAWLAPYVSPAATLLLVGIACLLMLDSVLDHRHRTQLDRKEEAEALAAAGIAVMPGGRRAYDPPVPDGPSDG